MKCDGNGNGNGSGGDGIIEWKCHSHDELLQIDRIYCTPLYKINGIESNSQAQRDIDTEKETYTTTAKGSIKTDFDEKSDYVVNQTMN